MMLDAFKFHGNMTRADLQEHFNILNVTTMQMHITALRDDALVFISGWRAPAKTGMWSPIYTLRSAKNEADVPHPTPMRLRSRGRPDDSYDEPGERVVVRGKGLKAEHAHMARVRYLNEGLGMWGALLTPAKR